MGMDVYGNNGNYFRNNCWYWRPLWNYVSQVCSDVISKEDYNGGNYNDGYFISENKCKSIVEILNTLLENGEVKKYEIKRQKELDNLPLEKCNDCNGTGKRNDKYVQGECNGCNGKGKVKGFDAMYPFEEENVREFRDFVKDSGGFEIC